MTGRRKAAPPASIVPANIVPGSAAGGSAPEVMGATAGTSAQRLDRWLWFSRAVKSRTLAAAQIEAGKIRVNAIKVIKPSQTIKPGDVVTSSASKDVRIFRVKALGARRGPATEAQLLYDDLTPKPAAGGGGEAIGQRDAGSGRPTKRDRRQLARLQGRN